MINAQAASSSPGGSEPTSCGEPGPGTDESQIKLTKDDAREFEFSVVHCEPCAIVNLASELKTLMDVLNFLRDREIGKHN